MHKNKIKSSEEAVKNHFKKNLQELNNFIPYHETFNYINNINAIDINFKWEGDLNEKKKKKKKNLNLEILNQTSFNLKTIGLNHIF